MRLLRPIVVRPFVLGNIISGKILKKDIAGKILKNVIAGKIRLYGVNVYTSNLDICPIRPTFTYLVNFYLH